MSGKKGEERKADKLGANNHHRNHQFGTTQKSRKHRSRDCGLGVEGGLTKRGGDMDVVLVVGRRGGNRRGREGEVNLRRRAEKALLVLNDTQTGKK